jgi:hypothetical protein
MQSFQKVRPSANLRFHKVAPEPKQLPTPGLDRPLGYDHIWIRDLWAMTTYGYETFGLWPHMDTRPLGYNHIWIRDLWAMTTYGYETFWLWPHMDTRPLGYDHIWIQDVWAMTTYGYETFGLWPHMDTRPLGYDHIWIRDLWAMTTYGYENGSWPSIVMRTILCTPLNGFGVCLQCDVAPRVDKVEG